MAECTKFCCETHKMKCSPLSGQGSRWNHPRIGLRYWQSPSRRQPRMPLCKLRLRFCLPSEASPKLNQVMLDRSRHEANCKRHDRDNAQDDGGDKKALTHYVFLHVLLHLFPAAGMAAPQCGQNFGGSFAGAMYRSHAGQRFSELPGPRDQSQ